MHIEYLHQQGGYTHQGPSGITYDFAPGVDGRRIAEVTDPTDQERFLSITDLMGRPLFVPVPSPFDSAQGPGQEPIQGPSQETTRKTEQADHFADASNMIEEPTKPKPKARKARYAPDPADVSASLD